MKALLYTLLILLFSCKGGRDYPKRTAYYEKRGTLYVEWADGKTEIYKGQFCDYPDKVILLDADFVKLDTLVSDTAIYYLEDHPELEFFDSLNVRSTMKYRYIQTEHIKAMKTALMKAQMKRVRIK